MSNGNHSDKRWKPTPEQRAEIDREYLESIRIARDELFDYLFEKLRLEHDEATGAAKIYLQGKKDGIRIAMSWLLNDPSFVSFINKEDPIARAIEQANEE